MDPQYIFAQATDQVSSIIACATHDKFDQPTPCTEWNVEQLLNHIINEVSWIPDLLEGKTIAEVGDKYDGDLIGEDAGASWQEVLDKALEAIHKADMTKLVHLSYGEMSASKYVAEVGGDVLIHSWDLGQAVNCSVIFEPKLAQAVYDSVLARAEEFKKSGLFGEPIPVSDNADIETRLLGFFGRKK